MSQLYTEYGRLQLPHSVGFIGYSFPVEKDIRQVLWENCVTLMRQRYGKENSTQFWKDAKSSGGTISRIKKGEGFKTLDTIVKIANEFGLEPWHLLVEGLDPNNPPGFGIKNQQDPRLAEIQELFARLDEPQRDAFLAGMRVMLPPLEKTGTS